MFLDQLCDPGRCSLVDLGDDDESATWLEYPSDFCHADGQIRPPEVRLHRSHKIECFRFERERRYGTLTDFDASDGDRALIQLSGHGYAHIGIIETVDFSFFCDR